MAEHHVKGSTRASRSRKAARALKAAPVPDGSRAQQASNTLKASPTPGNKASPPLVAPDGETALFDYDVESWDLLAINRLAHSALARFTHGVSPVSLAQAYSDWFINLAISPGKQVGLTQKLLRKQSRYWQYLLSLAATRNQQDCALCIEPLPQDHRFSDVDWRRWPFNIIHQEFLLNQQWWHNATTQVPGVSRHHERLVSFVMRQYLDIFSPSNIPALNPEVLRTTAQQGGKNLVRGAQHWLEDAQARLAGKRAAWLDEYRVGENLAATPGKVVYRNHLMELIQYQPATNKTVAEPILFVPAWIMKYYILDLSPKNSMVKYLVEQGYTVFMISWRNPGPDDRDIHFNDYVRQGILEAIEQLNAIVPEQQIHAVGYCLGGTLLTIAAAWLARNGKNPFKSTSLFAAQVDFAEAGELRLFIDESQVTFLEDVMWSKGYLDSSAMAGAFQWLRSNDLIWSRLMKSYLLGERPASNDLMAWNADSTRMPYRMHSEYLRRLFLDNDLANGSYKMNGKTLSIVDIKLPVFALATETDHVAPWRSVYKLRLLADTDITFVLTNGGHNAGVLSEPGHRGRCFRQSHDMEGENYQSPDDWYITHQQQQGSWWPAWVDWLEQHSSVTRVKPPALGGPDRVEPLMDAPGSYVLMP